MWDFEALAEEVGREGGWVDIVGDGGMTVVVVDFSWRSSSS